MSQYKLTYYDIQGLAEPCRYLFKLAGVEFEDYRIPKDDTTYPKLPADVKDSLPWGSIPVLDVDGKRIAQSSAICRFLANRFKLAGADEFEKAKCDEIVDSMRDFAQEWRGIMTATDDAQKAEMMKKMTETTMPFYMGKFEKIAKDNGKWMVGKSVTWADVIVAHFILMLIQRTKLPVVEGYPSLKKLLEDFQAVPQIKEWIKERPVEE